ncbi:DNA-directed RNA polymerase subunit N [Candidatus Marsarchaeota G2 archaeon ECH_B_SAG-G16]|jgi:DNA-directed RNA polymerase subunit N|uniref:DNA-directed RNA polymerase subunit Rpo10 n=5 Tax=Candidatus Marsarchaeota TaxID=1978152 RepID=A0A2R6AKC6_9ARCH|nr:MAG: DNA-directed RNA polymerase subunit N [Candidatus Marsarchaeota G1 archaeon BE_D]PSN88900.1 MAG: DNA-directed RNA polymerase subunit N [Candidatus Marsarchaeota G1 archaeon OSP_C]PSN92764.1 MAG: DNA-directed RNA polymerase subunit N [Candidatus Marsarchaeota G1 archaeon OSP_B]PSO02628.1 MAG: DNA-directed RNA polymerase subunit N [Candidatus Marsarchaeota G2 archaeon ECH_B_SAG-E12]PSO05378.1 MAG: DNA-directed RNA polymerase subunit N [Candidatus Marsarchaeota G2 archaeon ECH_B_SAG-G16]
MMFPVRCFTCGKVLAHYWEEYYSRVSKGERPKDVLDSMGIKRYCCRRMFISHVELIDDITVFSAMKTQESAQN